jgi:hypothetical protein
MSETVERNEPTPVHFTLGEAAKAVGRSKAAISRAISNGTLSAEKQPGGSYRIAMAELFRVYRPSDGVQQASRVADAAELNALNRELQAKLDATTERLTELRHDIADLREDRDHWRAQAERLLLAKPAEDTTEKPRRRWWPFGRRG